MTLLMGKQQTFPVLLVLHVSENTCDLFQDMLDRMEIYLNHENMDLEATKLFYLLDFQKHSMCCLQKHFHVHVQKTVTFLTQM